MTPESTNLPEGHSLNAIRQSLPKRAYPLQVENLPEQILFVRSDSYGDILLFSGVLALLVKDRPNIRVGLLLKARHKDVTELLPKDVTYLFTDADPHRESESDSPYLAQIADEVRGFDPDCVVVPSFERNWFHEVACRAAPEAVHVAIADKAATASDTPLNSHWTHLIAAERDEHELRKARRIAEFLSLDPPALLRPQCVIPESALREGRAILASLGLDPKQYIVCNPAGVANVSIKAWPTSHFALALQHLTKKLGVKVLLVGSESESSIFESLRAKMNNPAEVEVWLGRPGQYPLLAAFCASAQFYFGIDTSTLHLCEALGVPAIGIYGGGTGLRFQPHLPESLAIALPLPCYSCGWDCHLGTAPCVSWISVDFVINALDRHLASKESFPHGNGLPSKIACMPVPHEGLHSVAEKSRSTYIEVQEDRRQRAEQIHKLTQLAEQLSHSSNEAERECAIASNKIKDLAESLVLRESQLAQTLQRLAIIEKDASERLGQIEELTALARNLEHRAATRENEVRDEMSALHKAAEKRERLLSDTAMMLKAREVDANERLKHIEALTKLHQAAQEEKRHVEMILRNEISSLRLAAVARELQLKKTHERLQFVEEDSTNRLRQIEALGLLLKERENLEHTLASERLAFENEIIGLKSSHAAEFEKVLQNAAALQRGIEALQQENRALLHEQSTLRKRVESEQLQRADAHLTINALRLRLELALAQSISNT